MINIYDYLDKTKYPTFKTFMNILHNKLNAIELAKEIKDPNNYGYAKNVPLMFRNSNGRLLTRTPKGKIIFPNNMYGLPEEGAMYWGKLNHQHNLAIATIENFETNLDFWKSIYEGKNIQSFLIYKKNSPTTHTPKELKNKVRVIQDFVLLILGGIKKFNPYYTANTNQSYISSTKDSSGPEPIWPTTVDETVYFKKYSEYERQIIYLKDTIKVQDKTIQKQSETISFQIEELKKATAKNNEFTIWAILNCTPQDSKEVIKKAVINSLQKYHPDKVNNSGPLIQELAQKLTMNILEFKKKHF